MGASIHMHIEVKKGDKWYHYAAPHMYRDGVFFDLLAGINGRRKPVAPVRGLPMNVPGEDISEVTRFCYDQDRSGYSVHHASYLMAHELETLQERLNDIFADAPESRERDLEDAYFHTYINGNPVACHQG